MNIELVASTNGVKNSEEALEFGRNCARICYSEKNFEKISDEPNKEKLIIQTLKSGHHSVYDHPQLTFYFTDLPKIGAMILNNEKDYVTSEKSARYTQMAVEGRQKELYDKWMNIFKDSISRTYPNLDKKSPGKSEKLAQENARYVTSVFTPTKMVHTISFRQLNYLMNWFDDFSSGPYAFNRGIQQFMSEFNKILKPTWYVTIRDDKTGRTYNLDPELKRRRLSLFADDRRKNFKEEYGENYSTNYQASFACLAQLHRHRTIQYEIQDPSYSELEFFTPPILLDGELKREWINDLKSVASEYPQATLLDIHETGKYTDFISKANERLCGNAQLEIMNNTRKTLENYLRETKDSNPEIHSELLKFSKGPKCSFPNADCTEPCAFGSRAGIERLV